MYKSFSDFLSNNPSIQTITVTDHPSGYSVISDSNGRRVDPGNYWGACDGNAVYIVFRNSFYRMEPHDRGFVIQSFRNNDDHQPQTDYAEIALAEGPGGLVGEMVGKLITTRKETFYLNMETGEVHLEEIFGTSELKKIQKDVLQKQIW